MKKTYTAISAALVVGFAATSAQAAITISNSEAASFAVSNTDLLQTSVASVNASALNDRSSGTDTAFFSALQTAGVTVGEASLRDGVWYDHDPSAFTGNATLDAASTLSRGSAMVENDEFAEYVFDLTTNTFGYDINTIDLYSNWGSGAGRDEISVTISMSLVGTPAIFDQTVVTNASFNPSTETQARMNITGIDATGIAAIRFLWPTGQENNGVGYSELDVFGIASVPEPSAAVLGLIGALGLLRRRRS